jgi:YVTN family beta-propeller protein
MSLAMARARPWPVLGMLSIALAAGPGWLAPAPPARGDATSAGGPVASQSVPASPVTAYVVNDGSGTVTPIATATDTAGPPITVGTFPRAIAITPDGKTAYVVNDGLSGTVTPIATATGTAGPPITVGRNPYAIAITPDGRTAYVANLESGTVTPIATATGTAGPPITVGTNPIAIAITPDGKTAYVANLSSGTVTPIATATSTAGPPITVGGGPDAFAITPDGRTAYVVNFDSGTVTPIATATNTAGPPITVGGGPYDIVITPDGQTAYVSNNNTGPGFPLHYWHTVTPFQTATSTPGPPITVGTAPGAIAITPDGKTAYIVNSGSGTVTPITTATGTAGSPITVGTNPQAIAITPDGSTAYVSDIASGTVTPIATATNTAGPPITVGRGPIAIAVTPAAVPHRPVFTSAPAGQAAFGVPYTFTVTTTGSPAASISRTGRLPSGLRFTSNHDGTATISGTPAHRAASLYPLTLTATNKYGTDTQAFTLTITRAPAIQKLRTIRATEGITLTRTIRALGYPAPALTESGSLPQGLSFSGNGNGTAVLTGTPAPGSNGRYQLTITATNPSGTTTWPVRILVTPQKA